MKKSILYILFALFSLSAAVSLTACKDDGVEISGANKSKTPKNVKLLEYGPTSLTICWDFIRGATSYTVQLVDGEMNPVSEALCKTTDAIDYHEFTDLATDRIYYGRVRANFPYSSTSDWVYVTANEQPAMLMASVGILELDPKLTLNAATGSTLTYEWSYTEDAATDATRLYNIELFRDEACSELHVSWLADGKLASDKGIFTALAGYPVVRFTFSGLDPETTYYARVTNASFGNIMTPVVAGTTAKAGPEASPNNPAQAGDIVLAQDFAAFIHGGDIANFAAGYYPPSSNRGTYAAASGDNPSGFSATRCTANEFDLFSGGGVAAPYTEGTGLSAWGKSGNIAGRPGYVKMGAGSAAASLYTPELTALPDAATVKVRFSAQAYSEKYDGSGADAGKILVKAVRGAVLGAKGAITGTVTEVSAADPVDISAAKARFREFEATLTNVTPDCRIVISTSEKRALLDNVVVTCTAITPATKPAAPGGVSFDAAAAADRLTLKWNAVPDATSYTVAYWKGSASAPESEYAYKTGIASTATSQELTNLESNTSYWAKVKAVGSLDSDWSETANATTMDSGGEPLLPTADLLDVVFRNDGSAMDNSSSATPVRRMPSSRP